VSEETRAAYWAKVEEINSRISALEDERDALVLSDEDREFYRARHDQHFLDLVDRLSLEFVRSNVLLSAIDNPFEGHFSADRAKIGAELRIVYPKSYSVVDEVPSPGP